MDEAPEPAPPRTLVPDRRAHVLASLALVLFVTTVAASAAPGDDVDLLTDYLYANALLALVLGIAWALGGAWRRRRGKSRYAAPSRRSARVRDTLFAAAVLAALVAAPVGLSPTPAAPATSEPQEGAATPVAPTPAPPLPPTPDGGEVAPSPLEEAFARSDDAVDAMASAFAERPEEVHRLALAAEAQLRRTAAELAASRPSMDPLDARAAEVNLTLQTDAVRALDNVATWIVAAQRFSAALQAAETTNDVVIAARDGDHVLALGDSMDARIAKLAGDARRVFEEEPEVVARLGWTQEELARFEELAALVRNGTREVRVAVEELERVLGDAYHPFITTPLTDAEVLLRETTARVLSPELGAFFRSFDENGDDHLDVSEGRAFFYWVEENVAYRWDDERTTEAFPGEPVGDGRRGPDYQQSPDETYAERLGDCEDMNLLEVAFYNAWGIGAAQAYVNAEDPATIDHAIAIVRIAGTPDQFADLLGSLDSYTFGEEDGWPARGTYMIVDNAYSDDFGSISGGIPPDRFRVLDMETLFDLFPP